MSENLNSLQRRLERLEGAVLQEYSTCKLSAQREGRTRVVMAEETLERFGRELEDLKSSLYASGDTQKLQLVSEHHDALRIRMIYLQHLLEREIPRPYVDQALQDYGRGSHAAQGSLPTAPAKGTPAGRSLVARVFQRGEASRPTAPPRAPTLTLTDQMRLVQLHKLMQEDRQHLMSPAERPPHIQGDTPLQEAAYRFKVKFIAETHHGQRVATEKIARTPEELRAKLAKRATGEQGDK